MNRLPVALCCTVLLSGVSQAFELTGEFRQGGLLFGRAEPGEQVLYRDKVLQQDTQRRFIIGLDRDESKSISVVSRTARGDIGRDFEILPRDYAIQQIEGVAHKYVEPDAEQVARTRREAAKVWQARQQQRSQNTFFNGFAWPASGPITGVFGSQRVYNGQPRRPHYGVDIAGPEGTPVAAPADGLITLAEEDLFFSGGTLIIDHGHGLSSTFLHLSAIHVETGEQVRQGQPVAQMGATGRVTGSHLDWRMNWTGGGKNIRIDPQLLVKGEPVMGQGKADQARLSVQEAVPKAVPQTMKNEQSELHDSCRQQESTKLQEERAC